MEQMQMMSSTPFCSMNGETSEGGQNDDKQKNISSTSTSFSSDSSRSSSVHSLSSFNEIINYNDEFK